MALAGIVGNIAQFDPAICRFSVYVSRFRQFLLVNDIKSEMHSAVFIIVMGDAQY